MRADLPVVVLTGGIASGKTQVSEQLAHCGALIIDTDVIARELSAPDQLGYQAIVAHWGDRVLIGSGPNKGHLDRRALREIVFANPDERKTLERLLHPLIMDAVQAKLNQAEGSYPYAVIVIPLYAESPQIMEADAIVVVDVPRELQLERLMSRDDIDLDLAQHMLDAQASREQRLALATDVIDNTGDIDTLHHKVVELDQQLRNRFKTIPQTLPAQ